MALKKNLYRHTTREERATIAELAQRTSMHHASRVFKRSRILVIKAMRELGITPRRPGNFTTQEHAIMRANGWSA